MGWKGPDCSDGSESPSERSRWVDHKLPQLQPQLPDVDQLIASHASVNPSRARTDATALLWRALAEARLAQQRGIEAEKSTNAGRRDWLQAQARAFPSPPAAKHALVDLWRSEESSVEYDGTSEAPGVVWSCDDPEFPAGPGPAGCCPTHPPAHERGWEACLPHSPGKFCDIDGVQFCRKPSSSLNSEPIPEPLECRGAGGLEPLSRCGLPTAVALAAWSCDRLLRQEHCYATLQVCPQLQGLVDTQLWTLQHLLESTGCSPLAALAGQPSIVASAPPDVDLRRALHRTEASLWRQTAMAVAARSSAQAARQVAEEQRQQLAVAAQTRSEAEGLLHRKVWQCNDTLTTDDNITEIGDLPCGAGCGQFASEVECTRSK